MVGVHKDDVMLWCSVWGKGEGTVMERHGITAAPQTLLVLFLCAVVGAEARQTQLQCASPGRE